MNDLTFPSVDYLNVPEKEHKRTKNKLKCSHIALRNQNSQNTLINGQTTLMATLFSRTSKKQTIRDNNRLSQKKT